MSALAAALVAAQKAMPDLHKDSEAEVQTKSGGTYKYQYLGLEALLAAVRPVLNEHGIALVQAPVWDDRGFHALNTTLVHESGEDLVSFMRLPVAPDASAQVLGSALTYGRRYAILAVLALAPDEDDDGAAAQRVEVRNRQSSERDAVGPDGSPPPDAASRSEGFQAPLPATEKPVTQGVLDELKTVLLLLNRSFPEHPGEGRKWEDTAKGYTRDKFNVDSAIDLSLAQTRELIVWLEDEYQQAAREDQIPFEVPG